MRIPIVLVMCFSSIAMAHSGGTDSNGGHHNWADGSGRYHYHGGGGTSYLPCFAVIGVAVAGYFAVNWYNETHPNGRDTDQ